MQHVHSLTLIRIAHVRKLLAVLKTWMEGTPLTRYMQPGVDTALRRKLGDICAKNMLLMVFRDNFVHGDLHPGNIGKGAVGGR